MKTTSRTVLTGLLVASVLSILPAIAAPAFAAQSGSGDFSCPLDVTIHAGTTGTINCTFTYSGSDGSTVTFATVCAAGGTQLCNGWTIGAPSPGSFTPSTGTGSFTEAVSFTVGSPLTCGAPPAVSSCDISAQISATGGGLAVLPGSSIVAVSTIHISTPEFGVATISVVALSLFALLALRKRHAQATPFATIG